MPVNYPNRRTNGDGSIKQHISPEQLQELTPEQREKLKSWWQPDDGDWFVDYEGDECTVLLGEVVSWHKPDEDCYPLLSIGQCIQLLAEKNDLTAGNPRVIHYSSAYTTFTVYVPLGSIATGKVRENELIDALFAAVKAVL